MKLRKSQNIAISTIIIAAIGLIVLIVILAIFTDKANFLRRNVAGSCEDQGGKCASDISKDKEKCDNENYPRRILARGCGKKEKNDFGVCCLPPLE